MLIQQRHGLSHLAVVIGNLRKVARHSITCLRRVDKIGRQLDFLRRILARIPLVPRCMRLIRAEQKAERLALRLAVTHEPVHVFEVWVLVPLKPLPRKDARRTDMRLPALGDAIAQIAQVLHDTQRSLIHVRVVGISSTLHGIETSVDIVPRWRTHWRRLEAAREAHPLLRQPINAGRMRLSTIAPDIPVGAVIGNDEHHVGLGGKNRQRHQQAHTKNRPIQFHVCHPLSLSCHIFNELQLFGLANVEQASCLFSRKLEACPT